MTWQPIETAPRGQHLLLWVDVSIGPPLVVQGCWYQDGSDDGWIDHHGVPLPVSHWMPLPAPPQSATGAEEKP